MGCLKKYSYNGNEYTIDELTAKYGLCKKQIRERLRKGIALELKLTRGRKSIYQTFNWDGEEISFTEAMHRCQCGTRAFQRLINEGKSLKEIREMMRIKRVAEDGSTDYEPGWITADQVSKKFNVPYEQLRWIILSNGLERKNFAAMHGSRMAIRRDDITKAVKLTMELLERQKLKEELEAEPYEDYSEEPQKEEVKAETLVTNLEELRKAHPLVKDDRFFTESYFPHLDYFDVREWLGEPSVENEEP